MNKSIQIAGRQIGLNHRPYLIAEISANHNGKLEDALVLLEIAKECGVDAVKIQTYTPDTITLRSNKEDFQVKGGPWAGDTLYDLYERAQTPWEWHQTLFDKARQLDLTLFSTPFDASAVELLASLDTPAYKIASFEAVDTPLIELVAGHGKPMIISTGMASRSEIREARDAARMGGCDSLIMLHCVSGYPTPPDQSNLRTISDLAEQFDVISGLSDHTLGTATAITSIGLGACVIEKHFTRRRSDGGPDAAFSIEPHELKQLCNDAVTAWESVGDVRYSPAPSETQFLPFRRSLYITKNVKSGERLTVENVRSIRPGFGLHPKYINIVKRRL